MKKKTNKQIPVKPILKIMKDIKEGRRESQERVFGFNKQLGEKLQEQSVLISELQGVQAKIAELKHLIEMYRVIDYHNVADLWELETACGLTNKSYINWRADFEQTEDGFIFKTK